MLVFVAGVGRADTTAPIFDFVESGLLCPTRVVGRQDAPGTVSGELRLIDGDVPIALHTNRVPLRIGAEFGIRSRLAPGMPRIAAQVSVTHPPVPPGGQTIENWTTTLSAEGTSIVAFTFEVYEELQPGRWTFRIEAEGRVLVERGFDVVDGLTLEYQRLCSEPAVTS